MIANASGGAIVNNLSSNKGFGESLDEMINGGDPKLSIKALGGNIVLNAWEADGDPKLTEK